MLVFLHRVCTLRISTAVLAAGAARSRPYPGALPGALPLPASTCPLGTARQCPPPRSAVARLHSQVCAPSNAGRSQSGKCSRLRLLLLYRWIRKPAVM